MPHPRRRRVVYLAGTAGLLLLILSTLLIIRARKHAPAEVAFSDFLSEVDAGAVTQVALSDTELTFSRRDGRPGKTTPPPGYVGNSPTFIPGLVHKQVRIQVNPARGPDPANAAPVILGLLGFGLLGFLMYRTTAMASSAGKAQVASRSDSAITFADVAGVDEAKDEVKEIVDFLREPGRFTAVGGRIPRGVLLCGPPGTGKTLLARSIAGEAGVPFLFANGADFVEMFAGVGAARVRRLFRSARRHKACIVFIDELDSVGKRRSSGQISNEEREQTLNQLLTEMDGFESRDGIVVIAATNRADILDPALLRPGRFDRQVIVGCPDIKGREEILRVHTRKVPLHPQADLRSLARGTPGFSGADLANLVNEAALLAARSGHTQVTTAVLDAARDKVLMGVERRSLVMTEAERKNCAYHEAGHAVVAALLPEADPLHKVTIVPRGRALGVTMQLPEADRHTHTGAYLQTQVAVLMGGRVAEELFMGHMTSGASNDIERATEIASKMVCEMGMSPLGPLLFRKPGEGDRLAALSEETARRVDEAVRTIVMKGYDTASELLGRHRAAVHALAEQLLATESVDGAELREILSRHGALPAAAGPLAA